LGILGLALLLKSFCLVQTKSIKEIRRWCYTRAATATLFRCRQTDFMINMQRGSCKLKARLALLKNSIPFASAQDENVRDTCLIAGFAPSPQQTSAFALVKVSH